MSARRCGIRRKIDDAQLASAVALETSAAATIRRLGRIPAGGNYKTLYGRIRVLGLNTNHWTGQAHLRGKTHSWSKKIPLAQILVAQSPYGGGSCKLKGRLVRAKLISNWCAVCGISKWMGVPITLHLDHRNGDNCDNRLANLRLLCPNCHSQTATYCGRNKRLLRLSKIAA